MVMIKSKKQINEQSGPIVLLWNFHIISKTKQSAEQGGLSSLQNSILYAFGNDDVKHANALEKKTKLKLKQSISSYL